jgi:hypothetical protein
MAGKPCNYSSSFCVGILPGCDTHIRVEISGEPPCPLILLVQTSGLTLVCYKMNNHHQKHPTTKWKSGSRGINIGLLQNVMPKGFLSNFNIQHVTSCFVAGHFVAITSFYRSSGGISFCSHMRAAPTCSSSWLPTKKLQNVFRVKQQVATKWFGFFMLSCVIQTRAATKWIHSLTI